MMQLAPLSVSKIRPRIITAGGNGSEILLDIKMNISTIGFVLLFFFVILLNDADASTHPKPPQQQKQHHLPKQENEQTRPWLDGTPTGIPLLSKTRVSKDTNLYKFSIPETTLGIGTCSCLLVSPPHSTNNSSSVVRPYTPVSNRHERGSFSLLVKEYPDGLMSQEWAKLKTGEKFLFWQIPKNIKIQYPFGNPSSIVMLAAGTGITPMYQALQRLFGRDEEESSSSSLSISSSNMQTKVTLVFGCRTVEDIYFREELEDMQRRFPHRFSIVYVISSSSSEEKEECRMLEEKEETNSKIIVGRIDKEVIQDIISLEEDTKNNVGNNQVWVCGPPTFYNDICGPREEENIVGGALGQLGFDRNQVIKF